MSEPCKFPKIRIMLKEYNKMRRMGMDAQSVEKHKEAMLTMMSVKCKCDECVTQKVLGVLS